MKEDVLAEIRELGVLAVIRASSVEKAKRIVGALVEGGVTGIEITFTTPEAPKVVEILSQTYGDSILLGMGTLTEPEHAQTARDAGAQFLVSPHTADLLGAAMRETGLPMMMGALTPSEMVQALALGSDVVKVFPGSLFGPSYFKALRGPYPDLKLMPTGGVNLDNLADWFEAGAFAVGAGSALVPKQAVRENRYERVAEKAAQFQKVLREIRDTS